MPMHLAGWWPVRRRPRNDPLARATRGDLDIVMPPPYEMSDARQEQARAAVESMVRRLQPRGLDAGSRDVLNNLVNSWADQAVARLNAERDERQAVGEILIGLARQEVARRKPRYDADLAQALHAYDALDAAFAALAGRRTAALGPPALRHVADGSLQSSLGPVSPGDLWRPPPGPAPAELGLNGSQSH